MKLNQQINTRDHLLFLMTCWELETVIKKMNFYEGGHEDSAVNYISQSYFALPRESIRNNKDRLILFKQTFRDFQS